MTDKSFAGSRGVRGMVALIAAAVGVAALAGCEGAAEPSAPSAAGTSASTPSAVPSATSDAAAVTPSPAGATTPAEATPTSTAVVERSPSGRPRGAGGGTTVPAAAMLQLADLPGGFRLTSDDADGDWTLQSVTVYCRKPSPSTGVGQVASRDAVFDSPTAGFTQRVTRHSGDGAAASMDRRRQLVKGCTPLRSGDSLSIVASGLGGDESLLVNSTIEGRNSRWLVVRRGDLVTEISMPSDIRPDEARVYARRAAARLCAGTAAC